MRRAIDLIAKDSRDISSYAIAEASASHMVGRLRHTNVWYEPFPVKGLGNGITRYTDAVPIPVRIISPEGVPPVPQESF